MLYHAGSGGEPANLNTQAFTIELSLDAANWTLTSEANDNQDDITQHAVALALARYVKLTITKPNSGVDNKARISRD